MNYQITISTSGRRFSSFLQDGFYASAVPTNVLHKHNYAEIHVVANSPSVFHIGDKYFSTENGNILIIPGGVYHCCQHKGEDSIHSAFQVDCDIRSFSYNRLSNDTLLEFFREIERCKETTDYSSVAAYIGLFCSYFRNDSILHALPITDYGFLIHEFFTNNYSFDIHLSDLADELHLSERQAERLVIEHTGNSFREELCQTRVAMAKELLKNSSMSLSEIGRYVGYRSYAGFWKAMKKYE